MAKRGADKYLTDQNWDQEEDETEEKGEFNAASTDVIKERKILKAKRRCNNGEADSASSLFKVFSGFSNPTSGVASAATCSSDAQNPRFPLPLPFRNGSDSGSGEDLSELNTSLLSWINEHVTKDAACDLTPVLKSYCEQVEKLSIPSNSSSQVSVEIEAPSVDKKSDSTDAPASGKVVPLSELFKKSTDTWECTVCYVTNKNADAKCVACTSSRPGKAAPAVEAETAAPAPAATPAAAISLPVVGSSAQPSLAELFKKKSADEWECKGCWVRNKSTAMECVACNTKNSAAAATGGGDGDKPSEAEPVSTTAVTAAPAFSFAPQGGFSFKPPGGSLFNFGTNAVSSTSSSFGFKSGASCEEKTDASGVGFKFGTGLSSFSSTPFQSFAPKPAGSTSEAKDEENEEYVPPKVEPVAYTEEGAFYSVRCKLFYQKEGQWIERGLGNLFLKPSGERTQLLIRTDNSLGNILLNIQLTGEMPVSRQGSNNVSLVCLPNPPLESSKASKHPVCMLIRVKTGEMADELLAKINEHKMNH